MAIQTKKYKSLCQKFRPFFGRIDREDQKNNNKKDLPKKFWPFFGRIGDEDHKKRFMRGDENQFGGSLLHIYH